MRPPHDCVSCRRWRTRCRAWRWSWTLCWTPSRPQSGAPCWRTQAGRGWTSCRTRSRRAGLRPDSEPAGTLSLFDLNAQLCSCGSHRGFMFCVHKMKSSFKLDSSTDELTLYQSHNGDISHPPSFETISKT